MGRFRGRTSTNEVTTPTLRRREAAGTIFFAVKFGRAAGATGRVFGHFASFCPTACCLAVGQACCPTFDVVAHANSACFRAAFAAASASGSGRSLANAVTLPSLRRLEATRTIRFARVFGRAASATSRVFGRFAIFCLFALCLAVGQG